MSELNLVSPLLDGLSVRECFSQRGRSSCYYLERSETDEQFVVKHISIPESETKTQALILTGAVADAAAANAYYQGLVTDIQGELDVLRTIPDSGLIDYQTVPREGVGFDVYMLMSRKVPLRSFLQDNALTQLQALNLGLDLCEGLGKLHESGFAYLDLKPENVFVDARKHFQIGDLGLIRLDGIEYSAVAEEYLNEFSAPELSRLIPEPNARSDQYALGMLLFYVFNGNRMPYEDGKIPAERAREKRMDSEILPSPQYADYELAEIISKACSLDPAKRYASFAELRQELTLYMQRNEVSDQLLVPPLPEPEEAPEEQTELSSAQEESAAETEAASGEPAAEPEAVPEEPAVEAEAVPEEPAAEPEAVPEEPAVEAEAAPEEPAAEPEAVPEEPAAEPEAASEERTAEPEKAPAGAAPENVPEPELEEILVPVENAAPESVQPGLEEILIPASEIAANEIPLDESVVITDSAPKKKRKKKKKKNTESSPELLFEEAPDPEADGESAPEVLTETGIIDDAPAQSIEELLASVSSVLSEDEQHPSAEAPDLEANEAAVKEPSPKQRKKKGWVPILIALLVLALVGAALAYFYSNWYLVRMAEPQVVDVTADSITVAYDLSTPDPDLSWDCIDTYGNSYPGTAGEGRVQFQNLAPGTQYTIHFFPGKLHKLTGTTSVSAATATATQIESMTAVQAAVNTTAEIAIAVSGKEPSEWVLTCSSTGSDSRSIPFSGHSVEVTDLHINDTYTFELTSPEDVYLTGQTSCTLLISPDVQAANLHVSEATKDSLTLAWDNLGDAPLSWMAHCVGEGYDETLEVTECFATFTGVRMDADYTFTVSAQGLETPLSFALPKNARIVSSFKAEALEAGTIHISWVSSDPQPEGGWVVRYQVGTDPTLGGTLNETADQDVYLRGMPANAEIVVSLEPEDGQSVIGVTTLTTLTAESAAFDAHEFSSDDSELTLYPKPEGDEWTYDDLGQSADAFDPGTESAIVLQAAEDYKSADTDETVITAVVRSRTGSIVQFRRISSTWNDMWNAGRYMTTLKLPGASDKYQLELYFDGKLVSQKLFTINESESTEEKPAEEG